MALNLSDVASSRETRKIRESSAHFWSILPPSLRASSKFALTSFQKALAQKLYFLLSAAYDSATFALEMVLIKIGRRPVAYLPINVIGRWIGQVGEK